MKARDYCCCAIPTVNAGIYSVLTEQFVLGILAGTLAVATPSIVGAATPLFASWIFAIICYVGAAMQVFGVIGVAKEKPIVFRRYITLHIMITVAAFSVAAVWIALDQLCEIFPWVDIGIMGGLWVLLAIAQFYFYTVLSGYGTGQREDHGKYDSVYSVKGLTNDIPMTSRNDPWDSRDSFEGGRYRDGHRRQESAASDTAMLNGPYGQPFHDSPSYPSGVHTQDPQPTPQYNSSYNQYNDPYYSNAVGMYKPEQAQPHPGQS
ncbi:hypothetical protein EW146_g761 [Bondarzewia mesenterica]|uniref:Uncharacterized protein n=1 Tax=Bondarzewia mesenterica TaxID=1095465 RepID=A0A4S4M5Y7_9AGAM|nr:hypothetical protein EW146_g761 [Bondarzewia mesenterica]